jgi:hypothetical protein
LNKFKDTNKASEVKDLYYFKIEQRLKSVTGLKSIILTREILKKISNEGTRYSHVFCFKSLFHTSMLFSDAARLRIHRNSTPYKIEALENVKEFTLRMEKRTRSSNYSNFSKVFEFLCKSFPNLINFNIEMKCFDFDWITRFIDAIANKENRINIQLSVYKEL